MFQSLRPNNQLYILRKDTPILEIGTVISVSMPTPKYQMQPVFGQQEMVVDIVVKVNNEDITYQKVPATLDIADFGNNGVVISDSRDAMNSEILSLKKRNEDIVNNIDKNKEVISNCEKILLELNPELAEKQAQQQEINNLRQQMNDMSKTMEGLMESNKQLIMQLKRDKEVKNENVGN